MENLFEIGWPSQNIWTVFTKAVFLFQVTISYWICIFSNFQFCRTTFLLLWIRPVFIHFQADFDRDWKLIQTTCWLYQTSFLLDALLSQNVLLNLQFFKFPMQYNFCAKCTLTRPVWRIYPFQSWFWQNEECFCTQSHLNRFKILCQKRKKSSWKIIELQNWALHESVGGHRHKCIKEQFCEIKVVKKKLCCITNSRVKLCVISSYFFFNISKRLLDLKRYPQ